MEVLRNHISNLLTRPGSNFIFVRTGESVSNLAGTLAGWTNCKLSEYGKKQANLLYEGFYPFLGEFRKVYSSDLLRARDTINLSTLYQVQIHEDERLREIYYGDHEGEHFDSMPENLRNEINTMSYAAPKGESWTMVNRRALAFMKEKSEDGCLLCMTHGGLICTLTHTYGVTDVLPNASIAGISVDGGKSELVFTWTCPEILNK